MKRFKLNKKKIAKLEKNHLIGRGLEPPTETCMINNCDTNNTCVSVNLQSCNSGFMPCTLTNTDGQDPTNPNGDITTGDTNP